MSEILTLTSAAELLHTTEETVALAIRDRGLPAVKVGRAWVLVKDDVIEWLREQAQARADKAGGTATSVARPARGAATSATRAALDLAAALAPAPRARFGALRPGLGQPPPENRHGTGTADASSGGYAVQIDASPAGYVTIGLAATVTGYAEGAIRKKIERGIWVEGREWRRAPDGRVLISLAGYTKWVEGR